MKNWSCGLHVVLVRIPVQKGYAVQPSSILNGSIVNPPSYILVDLDLTLSADRLSCHHNLDVASHHLKIMNNLNKSLKVSKLCVHRHVASWQDHGAAVMDLIEEGKDVFDE